MAKKLSEAQIKALQNTKEGEVFTGAFVAQKVIDAHPVTLKSLEKAGYLESTITITSQRVYRLTPAGREYLAALQPASPATEATEAVELSTGQRATLERMKMLSGGNLAVDGWLSFRDIRASMTTLDEMVALGVIERKGSQYRITATAPEATPEVVEPAKTPCGKCGGEGFIHAGKWFDCDACNGRGYIETPAPAKHETPVYEHGQPLRHVRSDHYGTFSEYRNDTVGSCRREDATYALIKCAVCGGLHGWMFADIVTVAPQDPTPDGDDQYRHAMDMLQRDADNAPVCDKCGAMIFDDKCVAGCDDTTPAASVIDCAVKTPKYRTHHERIQRAIALKFGTSGERRARIQAAIDRMNDYHHTKIFLPDTWYITTTPVPVFELSTISATSTEELPAVIDFPAVDVFAEMQAEYQSRKLTLNRAAKIIPTQAGVWVWRETRGVSSRFGNWRFYPTVTPFDTLAVHRLLDRYPSQFAAGQAVLDLPRGDSVFAWSRGFEFIGTIAAANVAKAA